MKMTKLRFLFAISVAWGSLIFWLAPHPPMIDLPQHAGQVALLRDIVLGQSPWADLFRINVFTPYLIGYGLALPLSFIMPVATVLKLMLSLAYLAFVAMSVTLRKHFGADERLDWLFLTAFFGFCYQWGFFTFMVAAPVGMLFILISDRYARDQTIPRALATLAVGSVLLISHGLVFVLALMIGFTLLLVRTRDLRLFIVKSWPLVILVLMCGIYYLISQQHNVGMRLSNGTIWAYGSFNFFGAGKLVKGLLYTMVMDLKTIRGVYLVVQISTILALVACPWLLGLRADCKNTSSWIPLGVVLFIFTFAPSEAFSTSYVYERFSLFFFPAYAWIFTRTTESGANLKDRSKFVMPVLILCCWANLSLIAVDSWNFGKETAAIDQIFSSLKPGSRAITLMFDPSSAAVNEAKMYLHYPVWYQAEHGGLVDFNFAWFSPQIARYKLDRAPEAGPGFEWRPETFSWVKFRGQDYRYFFIRHSKPIPDNFFSGARCNPKLVAETGNWTVLENVPCE
ncbi:hypothetical protein AAKU67_000551 [Oxalobacteraceae bacterium GrIS 2.11]